MTQKIEWEDVNLTLHNDTCERKLLNNLSGEIRAGKLLAIIGPSLSGKTTLLNILSGRTKRQKNLSLSGSVLYDGVAISEACISKKTVCLMKDDMLLPHLTARETLTLAARFRMPLNFSKEEIACKVDAVMNELILNDLADTLIGNCNSGGISGGMYRLLIVAKELIKDPSVLFLDEPTTGLDSSQALAMMETMKAVAKNGRIVVAAIHHPSSQIFALFDQMLLLSEGRTMYFGPAADALTHFVSLGLVCPFHYNPADFFLDILSVNKKLPELEASTRARVEFIAEQWLVRHSQHQIDGAGIISCVSSTTNSQCHELMDRHKEMVRGTWNDPHFTAWQSFARWWVDLGLLSRRVNLEKYRNRVLMGITVASTLFFAVVLSLVYSQQWTDQKSIQDRTGLLFFVLINQTFTPFAVAMVAFPFERRMVSREIWGGAYQPSAYYAARVLSEMPLQILLAVVYSTIIYWATNLNPHWDRYLIFVLLLTMLTLVACALGYMISSVAPSAVVTAVIGWPVLLLFFLFGGFYINEDSMPVGCQWVRYTSPVYWAFKGLVLNEFAARKFNFKPDPWYCVYNGETVLYRLSFKGDEVWSSALALILLFCAFTALGYCGLLFRLEKYHKLSRATEEQCASVKGVESFGGLDMSTCPIDPLQPYRPETTEEKEKAKQVSLDLVDMGRVIGRGDEDEENGGMELSVTDHELQQMRRKIDESDTLYY